MTKENTRRKRRKVNIGYRCYYMLKKIARVVLPFKIYRKLSAIKNEGLRGLKYSDGEVGNAQYKKWVQENEKDIYAISKLEYEPFISVIVPVYNVADYMLIEMIESVQKQTYMNWELCLVDDKSTMKSVRDTLRKYEGADRIKILYREENGHISKATNSGFEMATGEFVALLDCDDLLAPNALYEMAKKLNENREYDFIYSDEDKISEDGRIRHNPFFKPDWSPDTFMSIMYTCHFSMYRKSLVEKLGGMRVGLEGAQDYDLVLRLMEKTNNIGHVPKILYHWRERQESTANSLTAKPYIVESTIKAKMDALKRRGIKGKLICIEEITQYRVIYGLQNQPLISIIIPSKDNYKILKQCIESVKHHTGYGHYEIIIVDNGSNAKNKEFYLQLSKQYGCKYLYEKADFNFSKMCNTGAAEAKGELLLFLNDDIKVLDDKWMEILAGHAQLEHTGAVGAKLLYPNTNLIQHAGVVNYKVGPGHCFIQFDDSLNCYYGRNILDYNFSIVTGACLMLETKKFREIGGFEEKLPVAYNDVDLCFKLVEHGYYNVLRNDVKLYHYESYSRGEDVSVEKAARLAREAERLYEMHPQFIGYDPCYNPNLTQEKGDFSLNMNNETILQKRIIDFPIDKMRGTDEIKYAIDHVLLAGNYIEISGWVFRDGEKNNKIIPKLLLFADDGKVIVYNTEKVSRPDVDMAYGKNGKVINCGFTCRFCHEDIGGLDVAVGIELGGCFAMTDTRMKG